MKVEYVNMHFVVIFMYSCTHIWLVGYLQSCSCSIPH